MSALLQRFRHYEIAEDPGGASLELWRTDREVVCLASVPAEQRWVELHVLAGVDTQQEAERPVVEAFRAHTRALQRVRDRRVLEVLEAGEDEGALFYVSEFVDGETLDGYLARCTPLPGWWAVEIARQLTLGLLALRSAPSLLARVQVFNARLTLEGEATADALVKLADFDLGGLPSVPEPDTASAEARAVHEVGRLLCYALSGMVAEQTTPRGRSSLPVPPEVTQLLSRLLSRPGRPSPSDLPGLLAGLAASALAPALATVPARLPSALRPRLPLAAHFPTLPRLGTELGDRLRLERTPFDAAQPYAQRGFAGTVPVTVQLLPPPRLLTPSHLMAIRRAAEEAAGPARPHLLRVLELPAGDDRGWFLEEGAPRLSLDAVRRLRRILSPGEAALLLREWHKGVLAIENRGLAPVALCPQQVFLDFPESPAGGPGDDQLASQPVHLWPAFKVKMRAHPVATHLAQPQRFLRERLLDPSPPRRSPASLAGAPAGQGAPTAADYAALFTWLCGGSTAVPADLAGLVSSTIAGTGVTTREAFLDALVPLIPRPPNPAHVAAASASAAKEVRTTPGGGPEKTASGTKRGKRAGRISPAPKAAAAAAASPLSQEGPAPEPAGDAEPPATGFLSPDLEARWEGEGGPADRDAGGFAEVLLGPVPALLPDAPEPEPAFMAGTEEETGEELPVGALFGGGLPPDGAGAGVEEGDRHGFDFGGPDDRERGPSVARLILLVVLAALLIAGLMAHFTGLAPWR